MDAPIAAQMGMINNLRTGDVLVDSMLCFLLPVAITFLMKNSQELVEKLKALILSWLFNKEEQSTRFCRTIEYVQQKNSYGNNNRADEKNNILQKAITLYLTQQGVNYDCCDMNLQAVKRAPYSWENTENSDDEDENDNGSNGEDVYGNTASQLKLYNLTRMPPPGEWVDIGNSISFRQSTNAENTDEEEDEGGGGRGGRGGRSRKRDAPSSERIIFELSSDLDDGRDRIEEFIQSAYKAYTAEIERQAKRDKSRYLYMPAMGASLASEESSNEAPKYKRYRLSEEKTFDSLFFPEKLGLLSLVDNFREKKGKYAIAGYPYKLGIMLHGPPGTGKTSLIKALAQYTKRHIVSIPLAKIKTNQELMDMILDQSFSVAGEDLDIRLRFQNTIFVMEDVDCANKVVLKRSTHTADFCNDDNDESYSILPEQGPQLPSGTATGSDSGTDGGAVGLSSLLKSVMPDKLDLSGILNVLDGVVDTPGRMLIMTTNHPDKLDPALIRPGRIDKRIELGYMAPESMVNMSEHYFQDSMPPQDVAALEESYGSGTLTDITPAQLEQKCSEYDSMREMVAALITEKQCAEKLAARMPSRIKSGAHAEPCRAKSGGV